MDKMEFKKILPAIDNQIAAYEELKILFEEKLLSHFWHFWIDSIVKSSSVILWKIKGENIKR